MRLRIKNLKYQVAIGVSQEEQNNPQIILISLEFDFLRSPKVCETDNIEDTVCYDLVSRELQSVIYTKKFHTIEYLAKICLIRICEIFENKSFYIKKTSIEVTKLSPAISVQCENVTVFLTHPEL